jgi:hypothetical protein
MNNLVNSTGWRPDHDSSYQFLVINLGEQTMMSGIQTKGLHSSNMWVQAFQIKYSNDNVNWLTVKNDQGGIS